MVLESCMIVLNLYNFSYSFCEPNDTHTDVLALSCNSFTSFQACSIGCFSNLQFIFQTLLPYFCFICLVSSYASGISLNVFSLESPSSTTVLYKYVEYFLLSNSVSFIAFMKIGLESATRDK